MMSLVPPAAYGTTRVMARAGHACPRAPTHEQAAAQAAMKWRRCTVRFFFRASLLQLCKRFVARVVRYANSRAMFLTPMARGKKLGDMGSFELSLREQQVLQLIAGAESNKSIARELGLSIHTVKRHVVRIIAKMNVDSRAEAAARWRALQMPPVPPAAAAPMDVFTSRERDVIERVVLGQSNMEIASQLSVSVNTVKRHTANILDKLAVNSRIEAAALLETRVKREAHAAARNHEEPMR